jgi:hypothetical protein
MDGASDQFLSCSCFAKDQHIGIATRHGSRVRERIFECLALTDDFLEVEFGADLIFQIKLFFGEFVLKFGNLAVSTRIF